MPESDKLQAESHLALEERIRKRAHEIYKSRDGAGHEHTALDDWLEAERQVLGSDGHSSAQNRGTTVGSAYAPRLEEGEE